MPIPNFDIDQVIERTQRKKRRENLKLCLFGAALVLIFLIARGTL